MKQRDYTQLLAELEEEYIRHSPKSAALNDQAKRYLIDGGNHTLRLVEPFPPRIVAARGAWITDEDGHDILDLWQGHLANILGHNPEVVTSVLARAFADGFGLQTGLTDRLQVEAAEILCRLTGSERVRFTTSGALATMYAILLSRAFTARDVVIKVGGGWHGAQPWGLKGVGYRANTDNGYSHVETEGLPSSITDSVMVTRFNDSEMLCDYFEQFGDRVACFIVEPYIGAGGLIAATQEYLDTARSLTQQYGAMLIFDEVISGFRFRAGDTGAAYAVQPDLATFGKIIGGGMPVAAVAGRADILGLAGRAAGSRVKFQGGTYSAHPSSMLASKTMLNYLVANESTIYPRLAELGAKARQAMETAFVEEGVYARCTGYDTDVLAGSSMVTVHFPHDADTALDRPEHVFEPSYCDVVLSREVLELALLIENVHVLKGHGAVSTAHTEADVDFLGNACRRVAQRIKPYL